jgi:alpha-beta hydrolase superfamily lysophospholipase
VHVVPGCHSVLALHTHSAAIKTYSAAWSAAATHLAGTGHNRAQLSICAICVLHPFLQDFGLHKYAENFANNGMSVFVFDYRGWGGSGGEPRHWLSAKRHMADWRAAITYVRSSMSDEVDVNRLCLWGSSFAGGHVLVVGSEPEIAPHITAIVSQVRVLLFDDISYHRNTGIRKAVR